MLIVALFFWYQLEKSGSIPPVGAPAPGFMLPDQNGKMHSLADYRGKWLVLYFYPKDNTPFCTDEACSFRDNIAKIRQMGAEVVGISLDDEKSHAKFAASNKLPFPILADRNGDAVNSYGVMTNLIAFKIAKRYTFLIDPSGRIEGVYQNVNPKLHAEDVIKDLTKLQK